MTSLARAIASQKSLSILMLSHSSGEKDQRIIRAARAAVDAGHSVTVLGIRPHGFPAKQIVNGITFLRVGTRPPGDLTAYVPSRHSRAVWLGMRAAFGPAAFLIARNAGHYAPFARDRLTPDIVHAHDLYTLYAGWRIAKQSGAKLVFDSHELEIGRAGVTRPIDKLVRRVGERLLIKRADAVITVSDSIADHLAAYYGIERPTVIHNTPRDEGEVPSGYDVRTHLMISTGRDLAVYVGGVTFNRGLVQIVEAMPYLPNLHVALVGPRTHAATEKWLRASATVLGVENRLHFVDPVPAGMVKRFISTADVSLVLVQDACLSYRYSFPNKLLESLLAGLPVVASKLPEYEKLISKTGAGVAVDQADPMAIAEGIRTVLSDKPRYAPRPEDLRRLESEYGWETQGRRLCALYANLVGLDERDVFSEETAAITSRGAIGA